MEMTLDKKTIFTKPIIYSIFFFVVGFVVFYVIQSMTSQLSSTVETLDDNYAAQMNKEIMLQRMSFIILIACSLTATIFSWQALSKRKSSIFKLIFIAELLTTISL